MKKLIILLSATLKMFSMNIEAQDSTYNDVLTFHPLHFINNGIRIDYDRKIYNNHWIQIGPQFYVSETTQYEDLREFKELRGAGVSVFHRIYVGKDKPFSGTYFSYGFTYNHFALKYEEDDPTDEQAQGETNINKFGGDIIIGYQLQIVEKLIIDFYAGLGGRYSSRTFKGNSHKKFNDFMYDYGYTGNVVITGVRIGFSF